MSPSRWRASNAAPACRRVSQWRQTRTSSGRRRWQRLTASSETPATPRSGRGSTTWLRTAKMRSLRKLIPGVHEKLPGAAQDEVKAIYDHAEEHQTELNLYIKGEGDEEDESGGAATVGAQVEKPVRQDAGT